MNESNDNPSEIKLSQGLTESHLIQAIEKSGYPLQTIVAEQLCGRFGIKEEWSYLDRDTNELRTIDILASMELYDIHSETRVRPQLDLIIECKQSQLPYVFFLTKTPNWLRQFPLIAGLKSEEIVVTSDDDSSSWHLPVLSALELYQEPFQASLKSSHTFSKCVRKGSEFELSGSDAYNGLVLPLVKAIQHFADEEKPVETANYFDFHLTFSIGVLDAAIVGVELTNGSPKLSNLPWVRVLRNEYDASSKKWEKARTWVVDVVHKDYFASYLDDHLIPFAKKAAALALKHESELADGVGFVGGMGKESFAQIESRLQPKTLGASAQRAMATGKHIVKTIFGTRQ